MIGAITLIVFIIGLVFAWFVIKYIGHLLGFFENPMQQKVVSGIKLKKKEVEEEVEEEVVVEEVVVEEEEWGIFTYLFLFFLVVVVGVFLYFLFDSVFFEILVKVIADVLKRLDALVLEFFRWIQQILTIIK